MNYVSVDDSGAGMAGVAATVLILVFFSGIPLGLLSLTLISRARRRGPWSSEWSQVFLAGTVFQACSLAASLFFLWLVFDLRAIRNEFFDGYGVMIVGVLGMIALNVVGLRAWRRLREKVAEGRHEVFPLSREPREP